MQKQKQCLPLSCYVCFQELSSLENTRKGWSRTELLASPLHSAGWHVGDVCQALHAHTAPGSAGEDRRVHGRPVQMEALLEQIPHLLP